MRTGPGRRPGLAVELAGFRVTSEPGNVRPVRERVRAVCADLALPPARLDGLETAVAEATLNAIEHGNGNDVASFVDIQVWVSGQVLVVRVAHEGTNGGLPATPPAPELEAKLRGEQTARGWGLFLMSQLVDHLDARTRGGRDGVELVLRLDGPGS